MSPCNFLNYSKLVVIWEIEGSKFKPKTSIFMLLSAGLAAFVSQCAVLANL